MAHPTQHWLSTWTSSTETIYHPLTHILHISDSECFLRTLRNKKSLSLPGAASDFFPFWCRSYSLVKRLVTKGEGETPAFLLLSSTPLHPNHLPYFLHQSRLQKGREKEKTRLQLLLTLLSLHRYFPHPESLTLYIILQASTTYLPSTC